MSKPKDTYQLTGREILALDDGTQGVSCVLFSDDLLRVLAVGSAKVAMATDSKVAELLRGQNIQWPSEILEGVKLAMKDLRKKVKARFGGQEIQAVRFVGGTGQMHALCLFGEDEPIDFPAMVWNFAPGFEFSQAVTADVGRKLPDRFMGSRLMYLSEHFPDIARKVTLATTPIGYIFRMLTGQNGIDYGEASGVLPIADDGAYDNAFIQAVQDRAQNVDVAAVLPRVIPVGQRLGELNKFGATLLGLPQGTPVAPGTGDQPAAMIGTGVVRPGRLGYSGGTSGTGNMPIAVGKDYPGMHAAIDRFVTSNSTPTALERFLMICCNNGTDPLNLLAESYATDHGITVDDALGILVSAAGRVPPGCDGLRCFPYIGKEQVVGMPEARVVFVGQNRTNNTPAHQVRAVLEGVALTLDFGLRELASKGFAIESGVATGGILQGGGVVEEIMSDVTCLPFAMLRGAFGVEGTAVGAGILAYHVAECEEGDETPLPDRVDAIMESIPKKTVEPDLDRHEVYVEMAERFPQALEAYRDLLQSLKMVS